MRRVRALVAGFTLVELLVVIAIIALLISILLPAIAAARRVARLSLCAAQMQQLGVSSNSYAHDHKDYIWNYSWRVDDAPGSQFADLRTVATDMDAQRSEFVDTFRRLTGRPLNRETTLLPQILYGHFVLFDYLAARLPEAIYTCPSDRVRLNWARDIDAFIAGLAPPYPASVTTPITSASRSLRWAYSSTYEVTISAFDGLQTSAAPAEVSRRLRNTTANHFLFSASGGWRLRQQTLNKVSFPSQKVFLHEGHARHDRRETYYAVPGASVNVLCFDGSVTYKNNTHVNRGWDPWSPGSPNGFLYQYRPDAWEPPSVSPGGTDLVFGFYRYTRAGLRGVDFGGKEPRP
ncbi:MAG: prepilin-type N-terminal cleavage/methylation domain-containing protein [Phycisphaerales bacterium]|nr:prepilin-type N-terminal cleavage/methylation domain-containing protein [Phycisphaerales bacterium]